jgi:hypothetical protein
MLRITPMTVLCLPPFIVLPLHAVTCSNMATASAGSMQAMMTCTEPRPQICTQDYRPVCALLQDGSLATYSNGCNACSDQAVTRYREGACE